MALGLPALDPLALSATKLRPGGLTAQEVAYKRKGIELGLAEQKLAADVKNRATEQKGKEANMKAFPPITETVALPYTQEWTKRMAGEQRQLANDLALFKQGKGSDPNNPLSEAGMARLARNIGHKQYASNTNAYYKLTNDLLTDIDTNPGSYRDGAKEEVLAAQRDVKVAETGEYPDLQGRLFDLQKHVDTELGNLKASGSGRAVKMADGSIKTTSSEYILGEDVKAGIKAALQRPEARAEARRWFAEMPKDDQDAVMEFAKNNGMTPDEAMIYNVEMPVYSYNKYKEDLKEQSGAGYGMDVEEAGRNWFTEAVWGDLNGTMKTTKDPSDVREGVTITDVPGNERISPQWNGWAWDTRTHYDEKGNVHSKVTKDIKEYRINDRDKTVTVTVGPVAAKLGDGGMETFVMPFSEVESKFMAKVGAANAKEINEKGKLDVANERAYGTSVTGTRGINSTITTPQGGKYNPTTSGGRFDPKK